MARQITVEILGDAKNFTRATHEATAATGHMEGALNRAMGPSTALALGLVGVGAGMGVLAFKAITLASNMEQTRIAFTTMLKSGVAADAFIKQLQNFAATTPFEFAGLTVTAQKLLAMGFQAKQVIPTLTSVGNAVAGLGGGQALIDRVTLAMGQMLAKGKVSGEEMRQLAEAGIPAWKYLATSLGITIPQAMKKSEAGAISGAAGIKALTEGMNKDFGGMMEKQSHTMIGIWSNIQDAVGQTLTIIGGKLISTFDLKSKMTGAMNFLQTFQSALQSGNWLSLLATMAPNVAWLDAWDNAKAAFQGFRTVFTAVGSAISAAFKPVRDAFMAFAQDHPDIVMVAVAGAIGGLLVPAIWGLAAATLGWVVAAAPFLLIGGAIAVLAYLLVGHWKQVTTWVHNTIMAHQGLINIALILLGPIGLVIKIVATLIDHWKDVAKWIGNVIQKIQELIGWIGKIKLPDLSGIGGVAHTLHIPGFDAGGVVPGAYGSPQLVMARGGETFGGFPPSGGRGGITINLYATVADGPSLDKFTNDIALRLGYATGT